ncbi:MAG: hypothetical protein EOP81_11770 [Variovorax sp.]|nr:MAG: hypothetical protein EOP81_11770 [Variovorax sp.]
MNYVYTGVLVGVLAVMAAAVVANGEVGNAELRLVEGARSAVEAVAPVSSGVLTESPSGATSGRD